MRISNADLVAADVIATNELADAKKYNAPDQVQQAIGEKRRSINERLKSLPAEELEPVRMKHWKEVAKAEARLRESEFGGPASLADEIRLLRQEIRLLRLTFSSDDRDAAKKVFGETLRKAVSGHGPAAVALRRKCGTTVAPSC